LLISCYMYTTCTYRFIFFQFRWIDVLNIQKYILLLIFLVGPDSILAQNLVPNHNFSQYEKCPDDRGQIFLASPWYSPNGRTTDFIHECGERGNTGIPRNRWGFQRPAAGTGYAGIRTWLAQEGSVPRNYREYLAVELIEPLQAGRIYFVSFKVSLGDSSRYMSDDIGLAFSDTQFVNRQVLPYTPVISNPQNQFLNNSYAWTTISGRYEAKGGEKHLAIGNFLDDTQISRLPFYNNPLININLFNTVYYFVDEVIVEPCDVKFPDQMILYQDTVLCPGEVLEIAAAELDQAQYTWENGSTGRQRLIDTPGEILLETEFEGCLRNDTLIIVQEEVPVIDIGRDTLLCPGETLLLSLSDTTLNYSWNNGVRSNQLLIDQPGEYAVETIVNSCLVSDTMTASYEEPLNTPSDTDTIFCIQSPLQLSPAYSNYAYVWQDNSTTETFTATSAGIYSVSIRNQCFEVTQNFYLETQDCGCISTIANVFSPNNDGFNDFFLPELTEGIRDYQIDIYDRWGRNVFSSSNREQSWNGTHEGNQLSPGVYFWQLSYSCINEGEKLSEQKQGHITLVR